MCSYQMLWTTHAGIVPMRYMKLGVIANPEILRCLRLSDICVCSYQLLWTTEQTILPVRYMDLEDMTTPDMLHYLQ
jgi:hypothetical protein